MNPPSGPPTSSLALPPTFPPTNPRLSQPRICSQDHRRGPPTTQLTTPPTKEPVQAPTRPPTTPSTFSPTVPLTKGQLPDDGSAHKTADEPPTTPPPKEPRRRRQGYLQIHQHSLLRLLSRTRRISRRQIRPRDRRRLRLQNNQRKRQRMGRRGSHETANISAALSVCPSAFECNFVDAVLLDVLSKPGCTGTDQGGSCCPHLLDKD
jgi:hypothetical protein